MIGHRSYESLERSLALILILGIISVIAPSHASTVQHARRISRDVIRSGRSERHTEAEPHVALDPSRPGTVVAVMQEGRYASGGAADNGYSISTDFGVTWRSRPLPRLTAAVGGWYKRASDPTIAIGPDGMIYALSLVADPSRRSCRSEGRSGIALQRSFDGGRSFGRPIFVQKDGGKCGDAANDKPWLAVDSSPASPHQGRLYAVWNHGFGDLVLRYSDDRGRTWSRIHHVMVGRRFSAVGGIPLVGPDGDLTVVFVRFEAACCLSAAARVSRDGGRTFGKVHTIAALRGSTPPDMRMGPPQGFPSASIDPVTGHIVVAWQDGRFRRNGFNSPFLNDVVLSSSSDEGRTWSPVRSVDHPRAHPHLNYLLPSVSAYDRHVYVAYVARRAGRDRFTQRLKVSPDGGRHFSKPKKLGKGNLRWAAKICCKDTTRRRRLLRFLGDYEATAAGAGVAYTVWADPKTHVHRATNQSAWAATIRP